MVATHTSAVSAPPGPADPDPRRVGRSLHPWAWWGWALGAAVLVGTTTNPLLLALTAFAVVTVVLQRRSDAPWARAVRAYLILGAVVIAIRLVFHLLLGGGRGATVLVRLPEVTLPDWLQGLRLFGPITAEGLAATTYDALRLAVMLLCVGAANALANPRRALRSVPTALYDVAVAVIIALTVAPQLVESALRVRRARRLRGGGTGLRAARALVIPVLTDTIDRSLALAAGMEARGYGRTLDTSREQRRLTGLLLVAGLLAIVFGLYAVLAIENAVTLAVACLVVGALLAAVGLAASGRRLRVTRYRPDPWRTPEWVVLLCGLAAAGIGVGLTLAGRADLLAPSTDPLVWPQLDPWTLLAVVLVAVPAFAAPVPPRGSR